MNVVVWHHPAQSLPYGFDHGGPLGGHMTAVVWKFMPTTSSMVSTMGDHSNGT